MKLLILYVIFSIFSTLFSCHANANERRIVIDTVIRAPGILFKANELREMALDKSGKPIDIILNSPGGGVYAGLQFINAMIEARTLGVRLRCHVPGMAASMAFQIFVMCDERYAYEYSMFLWHPVRVSGHMLLTPMAAAYLAWDLSEIEARLLTPLQHALALSSEEFFFHYNQETMWTAIGLIQISPKFLTIVTAMPILGDLKVWHPDRMRGHDSGDEDGDGTIQWDEFEIGPSRQSPVPSPGDCTSCHKPHGRK